MKIKDFVNVTRNKANNQLSFNLKSRQLKKMGITPSLLLNTSIVPMEKIKIPKRVVKEVKSKWK